MQSAVVTPEGVGIRWVHDEDFPIVAKYQAEYWGLVGAPARCHFSRGRLQ